MHSIKTASILGAFLILSYSIGFTHRFSFFSQDVHLSYLDVCVFVFVLISLLRKRTQILHAIKNHQKLWYSILGFSFIAALSLLISGSQFGFGALVVGSLYFSRWLFYTVLPFSLASLFSDALLKRLLLLIGMSTIITGLYQYFFFPDVRFLQAFDWDPHYFRIVGTWLDPGFTGLILVFILIHLTITAKLSDRIRLITWSTAYLAMALTYSRSSYLAFVVAFIYICLRQKTYKFLVFILVLFTFTLLSLPRPGGEGVKLERTSSIRARIQNWKNSLQIFSDYPVIGVGFNTYRYAQAKYGYLDSSNWLENHAGAGADSSLLYVAATTGVVGLITYLSYLRSWSRHSTGNLEFSACLAGILVHSMFLNSLFYPAILTWLAILTALRVRT